MESILPVGPDLAPGMWWFALVWTTVVGACVGSFLNVVIYRLPAGLSIAHPPSHCPECGHAIRWYDNIPIASWFNLRGRCRDCGTAISWRYPLVEATTAATFAALALAEPLSGGAALPHAPAGMALWLLFLSHAALCSILLVIVGRDADGVFPRMGRVTLAIAAWLALAAVWPEHLAFVPRPESANPTAWQSHTDALGAALVGVMFGCCLTVAALPSALRVATPFCVGHLASLPLIGAALGWQVVGLVALGVALLDLVSRPAMLLSPHLVAWPLSVLTFGVVVTVLVLGQHVMYPEWIAWLANPPWGPMLTVVGVFFVSLLATFVHHRAMLAIVITKAQHQFAKSWLIERDSP